MKKRVMPALVGAAAATAVGVSVSATAVSTAGRDAAQQHRPGGETIVFVQHTDGITPVHVPPKDQFYGDFIWFDGRLYDKSHTDVIGRFVVRCEETAIATVVCEGTFKLRGRGKLFTRYGQVGQQDDRTTGAIVGGTGDFIGAGGQSEFFEAFPDHTFDRRWVITLTD